MLGFNSETWNTNHSLISTSNRTHTRNGSLIIHRDDHDPYPGTCATFIHPPRGDNIEYRGEDDANYMVHVSLHELRAGANACGFCSLLVRGIDSQKKQWILVWSKYQWMDRSNGLISDEDRSDMPWIAAYFEEIARSKAIDEKELTLSIIFPKGRPYVEVSIAIDPDPRIERTRRTQIVLNRVLQRTEFYTSPGTLCGS
jgi:hypothetical protein